MRHSCLFCYGTNGEIMIWLESWTDAICVINQYQISQQRTKEARFQSVSPTF
uniref:Uncharacterized protein n=1 Tax=Nelumbo nucifera TaxID=4432 RepID=A0A822Z0W4_NELNU|nr:TPA_asm: hypothetical protein HUJ06_009058 [Nelumbo nucifera]